MGRRSLRFRQLRIIGEFRQLRRLRPGPDRLELDDGQITLPVPPEEAVAYICPVCWWENDVFISSDNEPSDENHGLTLSQGRENVRRFGTCDPRMKR